ncbi:transmembrane 7 superfamily member 3-like [Lycorma delicatula]|uniref:transmembrane 7 superfamily member 3-like n=1 Tax=Lycorma delicatula TaxID=130591 RepID=UPI003F5137D8
MHFFNTRLAQFYRLCLLYSFYVNIIVFLVLPSVLSVTVKVDSSTDSIKYEKESEWKLSLKSSKEIPNNDLTGAVIEYIKPLMPFQRIKIDITDIPTDVRFLLVEVHSYLNSVTLSYNLDTDDKSSYVTGTDIGLVKYTNSLLYTEPVTLYLSNDNNFNITVLLAVTTYHKDDPVPGGCNMEFETEIAPYLKLNVTNSVITVNSQPGLMPGRVMFGNSDCQIPPHTLLNYEFYHLYLPEKDFSEETYFNSVKSMIGVHRILENGKKVASTLEGPVNKKIFSNYVGTGSVIAVLIHAIVTNPQDIIIRNNHFITSAAYVPALTYGCSPLHFTYSCEIFSSSYSELIDINLFIIGLFLCFFGHIYFKMEMFLNGALASGTVACFIFLTSQFLTIQETGIVVAVISFIGGFIWLKIWSKFGVPIFSVLLPLLNLGFLVSAWLYYFFSDSYSVQPLIQSDINFWLAFNCGILSISLLFITKTQDASILSNSFIGSYLIILPFDQILGSNMKYIVINIYRRAVVDKFCYAIIDPPFQITDLVLLIVWKVLLISGYITQKTLLRGKPPFPPPDHHFSNRNNRYRIVSNILPEQGNSEEVAPILSADSTSIPQYT